MIRFILNDKEISTALPPGELLLDFIRYHQHLTGTKIGCREGDCGACTVLVGEIKNDELLYRSATCCLMALGNAAGKHIVTVEGTNIDKLNFIQQAMADEGATQCGFCTPGFVVSFAGFCLSSKEPDYKNAIKAIDGNICRCTGYKSIERAAEKISGIVADRKNSEAIDFAISKSIIPPYFKDIKQRLKKLSSESNGTLKAKGSQAKMLGGGTDLYVQQHETMVQSDIHFLFDKSTLNGIRQQGNKCVFGASATVTDLGESLVFRENFPRLDSIVKLISSTPIRNMATVAGNFINASPIGDLTILFLALDARLVLVHGKKSRELPLRKLYKGYKQLDKSADEFIENIWFELPAKSDFFNFEKVSKRTHLDIASVNSACSLKIENGEIISAAISAGGVGPVPMYLSKASEHLMGKKISNELVDQTAEIATSEISPISDARGTAEYKSLLLGQLVRAHFNSIFDFGY